MYDIEIHHPRNRAKILAEPMAKLLTRCGLSFRMELFDSNQSAKGGVIRLKQLRFPKASQLKRGRERYEDDSPRRMNFLLHRLTKMKPFEGIVWFPCAGGETRVKCQRELHTITLKNNRLTIHQHPKERQEDDRAMAVLARQAKPPRCLRILDAWQKCSRVEEDNLTVLLPDALRIAFRQAIFKHRLRSNLKVGIPKDPLELPMAERWNDKANNALFSSIGRCRYTDKFVVVNSVWAQQSQFAVFVHSNCVDKPMWGNQPKDCPSATLDVSTSVVPAMTRSWTGNSFGERDKHKYELRVYMPDVFKWYVKVYLQGISVVDDSLVLDSKTYSKDVRLVKALRFRVTALGKRLDLEDAVVHKDDNGKWNLTWRNDDPRYREVYSE